MHLNRQFVLLSEFQESGVHAGITTTAGANLRTFTAITHDAMDVDTFKSNGRIERVLLPGGTYHVVASAPYNESGGHKLLLRQSVSEYDNSIRFQYGGTSEINTTGSPLNIRSNVDTILYLEKPAWIDFVHDVAVGSGAPYAMGYAASTSFGERYATARIERL